MAIAFVNGTATDQATGATLTCTFPTHTYTAGTGQICYAYLVCTLGATVTATGWTQIASTPTQINAGWGATIMQRILDGTETGSVAFTATSNNIILGTLRLYSGVNTTTPRDTASGNPSWTSGATGQPSTTGFTTNQNGDEIVCFAMDLDRTVTLTTPTGFGNPVLDSTSGNAQAVGGWDKAQASAGAIGTVTSGGVTSGDHWSITLLALQQAATTVSAYIPDYRLITKRWRTARLKPKLRKFDPRNNSGASLLFSPVHPLPNYQLRQDKPHPPPVQTRAKRKVHYIRDVIGYNIIWFYFSAPRKVKRKFTSVAPPPKFHKVFDHPPYRWGIGYWLTAMPIPRRMRAAKIKVKRWVRRKVYRNFGTFAPVSTAFYVAFIRRDLHPLRVTKIRPRPQRRRVLAGAGLLFQAVTIRNRRSRKQLRFPMTIHAAPFSPHERIRRVIANAQAIIVAIVPLHFRKARLTLKKAKPQKPRMLQRIRRAYSGFAQTVGSTVDAIMTWRNRGGY